MDEKASGKITALVLLGSLVLQLAVFGGGFWLGYTRGTNVAEIGLADLEAINNKLTEQNRELVERVGGLESSLNEINGRITTAQGLAGSIEDGLGEAASTIDRALARVDRLTEALSVVFDGWKD